MDFVSDTSYVALPATAVGASSVSAPSGSQHLQSDGVLSRAGSWPAQPPPRASWSTPIQCQAGEPYTSAPILALVPEPQVRTQGLRPHPHHSVPANIFTCQLLSQVLLSGEFWPKQSQIFSLSKLPPKYRASLSSEPHRCWVQQLQRLAIHHVHVRFCVTAWLRADIAH